MKSFSVLLFVIVLVSAALECNAQRGRRGKSAQSSGGGIMSRLGMTEECVTYAKNLVFEGEEMSMAKCMTIPQRIPQIFMQLMTPGNPCMEIFTTFLGKVTQIAKMFGLGNLLG